MLSKWYAIVRRTWRGITVASMFAFLTAPIFIHFATTVSKINFTTDNIYYVLYTQQYSNTISSSNIFNNIQSNRTHFKEWGGSGNSSLLTWIYAGWRSKLTGTGNCFLKSVMWKSRNARSTFYRFNICLSGKTECYAPQHHPRPYSNPTQYNAQQ